MEKNDKYTWVAIIVIAIAALAVLYTETHGTGSGPINLQLNVSQSNITTRIYPYQSVFIPVEITNAGTDAIKSVGIGIFVNNNLTSIYNVSLPTGRNVYINFSKQFTVPGTYNVSFISDPSKLYDLVNRNNAQVHFQIIVQAPATPSAYTTLPSNWTGEKSTYLSKVGYLTYSYLVGNYGLSNFALSKIPAADAFFTPLLNLTYSYINSMYSAEATYPNASAYSLWLQGSLSSNVTAVWAQGLKLKTNYTSINGTTLAVTHLNSNTTTCGWYNAGWLKTLTYEGAGNCAVQLAKKSSSLSTPATPGFLPAINGSTTIANVTGSSILGPTYGRLAFINSSIIYEGAQPNTASDYVCYGVISTLYNRSYCSTYLFGRSGSIGALSLVRTTAFVGQENLSVISLVNTSYVAAQSVAGIRLLSEFNVSGQSQSFSAGLNSSCGLNFSLSCRSPSLVNGNLTLQFYNKINQTFTLRSIACYQNGSPSYAQLNLTIRPNATASVTSICYSNGNVLTGLPLGLTLKLGINYTLGTGNATYRTTGSAYIV